MIIELPYFDFIEDYFKLFIKYKKVLKENTEIVIYDNLGKSIFNGGRIRDNELTESQIKKLVMISKITDISIGFVLSNNNSFDYIKNNGININEEIEYLIEYLFDLSKKINIHLIIGNDELYKILKREFNIKNIKNIRFIKSITSLDINFNNYIEYEKTYDYIVPRVEIYSNLNNFNDLNLSKYILLNSFECSGCPFYNEHYNLISSDKINPVDFDIKKCFFKDNEKNGLKLLNKDSDLDYEYHTSEIHQLNYNALNKNKFAGLKIGRNDLDFEKIKTEFLEILKDIGK
jgi:hypothetical protein